MGDSSVLLDASEIDTLIDELNDVRSDLLPFAARVLPRDHQFVVETNPVWQTVRNPLFDGLVVFLRHSGLGWIGFAIPNTSIIKLVETMNCRHECDDPRTAAPR
jgi:hypothetical protein